MLATSQDELGKHGVEWRGVESPRSQAVLSALPPLLVYSTRLS